MIQLITARRISILIVLAYAAFILFAASASQRSAKEAIGAVLAAVVYSLMPLACIWFGDEMGDYIGTLPGPAINRRSPGWMVKIAGWFLLLFPAILFFFTFPNS